jgi:hypothetical protein
MFPVTDTSSGYGECRVATTGRLVRRLSVALLLLLPFLLAGSPAQAQTPSTLDTLRVVNVSTAVADSFTVDVYLRNVDSLGSYNFRIVWDETVIEPLTDTSANGDTISVELQVVRGVGIWENLSAGMPSPGVLTFLALNWDIGDQAFMPGAGVAVRMNWRVVPGVTAQTTSINFENDPAYPASYNTITDSWARVFKRPVLTNGAVTITGGIPVQGAPTIPPLNSPLSVNQGDLLTFNVTATDPDGDSLRLLAFNLPTGAQFTPANPVRGKIAVTGTFRWSPNFAQSGSYVVSFQATDSSGLTSTVRNVTINVNEVARDLLFTTSVAGQEPQGGVPGATEVVIPINLTTVQTAYGVQFDFVYDPSVFVPTSLQPTDKLTGFTIYDNLGATPGRLRVVTFSLAGDPIDAGSSNVLFNVIGNIAQGATPGAYDLKFENTWESINPDPNIASVQLASTDGKVYVDYAGDVNLDGRVDVADVVAVVGYILGDFTFTGRQFGAGDVNHDALLDVFDLVIIINSIFGTQPLNGIPASGGSARVDFVYDATDGPRGSYRLAAAVPTDVAGAQIEIEYDPHSMAFAEPERLPASSALMLRCRDNGRGRLVAILLYNPQNADSRIRTGSAEILRIPLAATVGNQPGAYLSDVKLSDPQAGRIEVTGLESVPRDFTLEQNYPNPFNAATTITFALEGTGRTTDTKLEIFNVLGQKVTTLVDGPLAPGRHTHVWDGADRSGTPVASGLYFYRLTSGNRTEMKKMVLLK